ncbi:MAG: hypothetical protein L0271_25505 [Gemmatimonadetes bacterium]|nr:hypothetical protein [Gemmatimonadota bacterium]
MVGDYDQEERTLLIRESKFHKSRLLPLSPDGSEHVQAYLQACRSFLLVSTEMPLLCSPYRSNRAYTENGLRTGIQFLLSAAGIRTGAHVNRCVKEHQAAARFECTATPFT